MCATRSSATRTPSDDAHNDPSCQRASTSPRAGPRPPSELSAPAAGATTPGATTSLSTGSCAPRRPVHPCTTSRTPPGLLREHHRVDRANTCRLDAKVRERSRNRRDRRAVCAATLPSGNSPPGDRKYRANTSTLSCSGSESATSTDSDTSRQGRSSTTSVSPALIVDNSETVTRPSQAPETQHDPLRLPWTRPADALHKTEIAKGASPPTRTGV